MTCPNVVAGIVNSRVSTRRARKQNPKGAETDAWRSACLAVCAVLDLVPEDTTEIILRPDYGIVTSKWRDENGKCAANHRQDAVLTTRRRIDSRSLAADANPFPSLTLRRSKR